MCFMCIFEFTLKACDSFLAILHSSFEVPVMALRRRQRHVCLKGPHELSDVGFKSSQVTVSLLTGKLPLLVDLFGDKLEGQTRYNAG